MIVGVGIDIVEIGKIAKSVDDPAYLKRVFTPGEMAYCQSLKNGAQSFAGRFAAKEAFMKAIGQGIRQGVWFTDVEVVNAPGGAPMLQVSERMLGKGILPVGCAIHISISHSKEYATAVVIIEK